MIHADHSRGHSTVGIYDSCNVESVFGQEGCVSQKSHASGVIIRGATQNFQEFEYTTQTISGTNMCSFVPLAVFQPLVSQLAYL
jgi:hypothetical protein